MQARAGFRNVHLPAGRLSLIVIAVLAAFLLGVGGGYLARGLSSSAPSTATNSTHNQRPFVVEPVPYGAAGPSPASEPTRDPKGFAVPI
jgi:hypothetical protein